jgi:repressor LexA
MSKLTARQNETLKVIKAHIKKNGYPPTIREIGAAMGISSPNGVAEHLDHLEDKGYISRNRRISRAIVVL